MSDLIYVEIFSLSFPATVDWRFYVLYQLEDNLWYRLGTEAKIYRVWHPSVYNLPFFPLLHHVLFVYSIYGFSTYFFVTIKL